MLERGQAAAGVARIREGMAGLLATGSRLFLPHLVLKAIIAARRQEAKLLELRSSVNLARLWQAHGKQEEAHQILAEIYGWFTEGFETVDLREAKALLETSLI